ncbi:hypothetical protein LWI29_020587 [Acer saccharum]|uniref:DUF2921 domain-containing protein n=1 Tax=Acer saccharum TaxID=4024 RepID=A0AA39W1J6_ACESA|nr:hypothetical protein LWI29_020587 [Acer saccharum]
MVRPICSVLAFPVNKFRLEYASGCYFAKTCNPLGDDHVGFLLQLMFLSPTECSPDGQSVRFFIEFPNSSSYDGFQINPFNPNTKFVGEGTWDWKKNRLRVVACRFTKKNTSLSNSQVTFRSTDNNLLEVPGLKYEYINRQGKNVMFKEKPVKKSEENFSDGFSIKMSFYTSVRNSREEFASGYWNPISVGDRIFQGSSESSMTVSKSSLASSGLYANISYKISLILRYDVSRIAPFDIYSSGSTQVEISAEGIYDAETGSLCMVGCRYVGLNNQNLENDTIDCEICVNLQFSSLNAKKDGVDITGSIISLRDKSDSLHFESVYVSSTSFNTWRIDMEIFTVLISNTLP